KLDPSWIKDNKDWVNALARDVSNPSEEDRAFPVFRNFDFFVGHSWSQGLFPSGDGKDLESTSEEIHFHYGTYLWAKATNQESLEKLSRVMLAVSIRSFQKYFYFMDSNTLYPVRLNKAINNNAMITEKKTP